MKAMFLFSDRLTVDSEAFQPPLPPEDPASQEIGQVPASHNPETVFSSESPDDIPNSTGRQPILFMEPGSESIRPMEDFESP